MNKVNQFIRNYLTPSKPIIIFSLILLFIVWSSVLWQIDQDKKMTFVALERGIAGAISLFILLFAGWMVKNARKKRQAQEIMTQNEERLRTFVQNTPIVFYAMDSNGIFTLSEGFGLSKLGLEAGQAVGHSAFEMYGEYPDIIDALQRSLHGETVFFEHRVGDIYLNNRMVPLFDEKGKVKSVIGATVDITERVLAEHGLKESYEELTATHEELIATEEEVRANYQELINERAFSNAVLDSVPGLLYLYDSQGRLIRWNKNHETATGYSAEELAQMTLGDWYKDDQETYERIYGEVAKAFQDGMAFAEGNLQNKDGSKTPYYFTAVKTIIDCQTYIVGIGIDISEQKKAQEGLVKKEKELQRSLEELTASHEELVATEEELRSQYKSLSEQEQELALSEERYKLAVEGSSDIIWDIDLISNSMYYPERLLQFLGVKAETAADGLSIWHKNIHPEDREKQKEAYIAHLEGHTPFYSCEYRIFNKNEELIWISSRGKAIRNTQGKAVRIVGSLKDITAEKNLRDRLEHMAFHDVVTQLPNRLAIERKFRQLLEENQAESIALVLLDLDNFKTVNDMHGHIIGDMLLAAVAERLNRLTASDFFVARFGGDEFIIILSGVHWKDGIEQTKACFAIPFLAQDHEFHVTCSMGIAIYPIDGKDVYALMQSADMALYQAKDSGKNGLAYYTNTLRTELAYKNELINGMKKALDKQQFCLHYQPIIAIQTGDIQSFEALLRWHDPEKGMVSPMDFIPLAEETKLIVPIGEWVLTEACTFSKSFSESNKQQMSIAVNVSPFQLEQPDFVDMVTRTLQLTGLAHHQLELEITETVLLQSFEESTAKLNRLREIGVRVALDDFGTGYSSLTYLQRLPIDVVKIDRAFIKSIHSDSNSKAVVESIIGLAHRFGFTVIAEGIETDEQLRILKNIGCDMGQGYYFSRPLAVADLALWIEKNHKPSYT